VHELALEVAATARLQQREHRGDDEARRALARTAEELGGLQAARRPSGRRALAEQPARVARRKSVRRGAERLEVAREGLGLGLGRALDEPWPRDARP
jgi:hypothetical protein